MITIQTRFTDTHRRLKWWGSDATMIADGYTAGGIDQFAFIKVYQLDETGGYIGDMSANNVGPTLSHTDMLQIADMQIPDDYNVEQKMQWLTWSGVDSWGAPMRIPGGGDWKTAPAVQMIGAVWAGNMVEVLERRSFIVRYNGVLDDVPMSRIRTFTRADFGKSYATDPHIVHNVLAVGGTDKPHYAKGKIYLPLIFKYASVWTFDRWLE